jgi:multidrug resistance efflux pump
MTAGGRLARVLLLPWTFLTALWTHFCRALGSPRTWVLALLAVIVVLIVYYAFADRYTPYTSDAYVQAYVVQIAARVEGQVTAVHVRENERVPRGGLLFEIDPRPFEHRVQQLEAKLALMAQRVAQMESELAAARAEETRVAADESYAQAVYRQELSIFKQDSTTERRYLDALQKHRAQQALREKALAQVRQVEQALAARLGDEHALVAEARAMLAEAKLQLEWTRVYAPDDSYITNLQLRQGSYVRVGQPVLTCINAEQCWIVANFRENGLEYVRAGQPAEISFNSYPGRVFAGRVQSAGWGVSQGQGVPSGELPEVRNPQSWIRQAQRFQVRIVLDEPPEQPLRVGATAAVTVYTTDDFALNPVARAWQRVMAWFDYLY